MLKPYREVVNEGKMNLDLGETVAFEDELSTKVYKNADDEKGKKVTFPPNTEFEVVMSGVEIVLKHKSGLVYTSQAEYKALGGHLI